MSHLPASPLRSHSQIHTMPRKSGLQIHTMKQTRPPGGGGVDLNFRLRNCNVKYTIMFLQLVCLKSLRKNSSFSLFVPKTAMALCGVRAALSKLLKCICKRHSSVDNNIATATKVLNCPFVLWAVQLCCAFQRILFCWSNNNGQRGYIFLWLSF